MGKVVCPKCKGSNLKDLGAAKQDNDAISKICSALNWAASGGKSEHKFECNNCKTIFIAEKDF